MIEERRCAAQLSRTSGLPWLPSGAAFAVPDIPHFLHLYDLTSVAPSQNTVST
jgi:hypothetical protein